MSPQITVTYVLGSSELNDFFTDHFSRSRRAIGRVCAWVYGPLC